MAINKAWHLKNKMPTRLPAPKRSDGGQKNPSLEQKIKRHKEHAKNCSYWPMPEMIKAIIN